MYEIDRDAISGGNQLCHIVCVWGGGIIESVI
jgi:hypothetical protein